MTDRDTPCEKAGRHGEKAGRHVADARNRFYFMKETIRICKRIEELDKIKLTDDFDFLQYLGEKEFIYAGTFYELLQS